MNGKIIQTKMVLVPVVLRLGRTVVRKLIHEDEHPTLMYIYNKR